MNKIKLVLTVALLLIFQYCNAQNKDYNFKYCNEIISTNTDNSVVTKFLVNGNSLTENEKNHLIELLYEKTSIYDVILNSKNTEVYIYHLSDVTYEDIKLIIQPMNIELNFISTSNVEFQYNNVKLVEE